MRVSPHDLRKYLNIVVTVDNCLRLQFSITFHCISIDEGLFNLLIYLIKIMLYLIILLVEYKLIEYSRLSTGAFIYSLT